VRRLALLVVLECSCGRIDFGTLASPDADGGAAATCNAVTRIFDDFEDGIQDPIWSTSYAEGTSSYAETGGNLVLTLEANRANTYCAYSTGRLYDLRGHRMFAEIAQVPNTGAELGLAAQYNVTQYLHISEQDGTVTASQSVANVFTIVRQIPYDALAHRFLGLEEQGGQLLFETSPDGVTFTPFAQVDDPFDVSLVRPQLYAGTFTAVANPGVARFASFNAPVPHEGGCPISTLVDTFDDGVQGHEWEGSYAAPCCTITEAGGMLHIATDGTPGFAARMSSAGYDLREGHLTVAMPAGPTGNVLASLRVDLDSNNSIELQARATTLDGTTLVGGTTTSLGGMPRLASQSYLQLRESAGTLYYEVSTDRVNWMAIHMVADPFALDDVRVVLQGGISGTTTFAAASVDYANLDTP
jgi:hypothetical protein